MIKEFFGLCFEKGCYEKATTETSLTSNGKTIKNCSFCSKHANGFARIAEAILNEKIK